MQNLFKRIGLFFCFFAITAQAQNALSGRAFEALGDGELAAELDREVDALMARNGMPAPDVRSLQREVYHSRIEIRDEFIRSLVQILSGEQPGFFRSSARRDWNEQVEHLTAQLERLALTSPANPPAGLSVIGDHQNPYKDQMRKLADLFVYNVMLAANAHVDGRANHSQFRSESAMRVLIEAWLISGMNKASITAMVNASRLTATALTLFLGAAAWMAGSWLDLHMAEQVLRGSAILTGLLAWRDFRRGSQLVPPPRTEAVDTNTPHRATYRPSFMLGFQRRGAIRSEAERGMWAFWFEVRRALRQASETGLLNPQAVDTLDLSRFFGYEMTDSHKMSEHLTRILSEFAGEELNPIKLALESCKTVLILDGQAAEPLARTTAAN